MMKYFKLVKINLKYSYYYDNITFIKEISKNTPTSKRSESEG